MTSSSERYTDGSYLAMTQGSWHEEDSPWKAAQVRKMFARNSIRPRSVCEIGCGAGGILHTLQADLPEASLVGYDISPQAHELSRKYANERCRFVLGDAFTGPDTFDVALVLDVVEHVEDCFAFMRQAARKAALKIYNIPLDAYVHGVLRGANSWDTAGHLHLFTMETALKSVRLADQEVLDYFIPRNPPMRHGCLAWLSNLARRALPAKIGARLFGGSIMILAR